MVNVLSINGGLVTNQQVQVLQEGHTIAPVSNQRTRSFMEQARQW